MSKAAPYRISLVVLVVIGGTCSAREEVGVWMKYEKLFESGASCENPLYEVQEFVISCTAWSGALKSAEDEWLIYLKHRVTDGHNVIQFVTTQWRGSDADRLGQAAFEGCGQLHINPDFYKRLDQFISVSRTDDLDTVVAYAPVLRLFNTFGDKYRGRRFNPVTDEDSKATVIRQDGLIEVTSSRP
jgi:hypothetical protein